MALDFCFTESDVFTDDAASDGTVKLDQAV